MTNKVINFWRKRGTKALAKRITKELEDIYQKKEKMPITIHRNNFTVKEILKNRYMMTIPMLTRRRKDGGFARVNIITDSVQAGSLFGGVGTALLFSICLANRLDAQCRVITRTEKPDEIGVFKFLKLYNMNPKKDLQFKFEPCDEYGRGVELSEDELFITTSWWTTASTLQAVEAKNIIYLLQEDERMFYPIGDDWVRAHETMRNKDIQIILNTKLLFEHLVSDGFINILNNGLWFEPAFPHSVYTRDDKNKCVKSRKKFFFYARPNNPRNLFYLGLEIIERSLMMGIIKPEDWDIYFVGSDIPNVILFGGIRPIIFEKMPWNEYSKLLGTIDVGLSLMSTPHPSYPPLDLAASGAVAVTNKFGIKKELSSYSKNIISANLTIDKIVSAIDAAIKLSENEPLRSLNYFDAKLCRNWEHSFQKIIDVIIGKLND